MDGKDKCKYCGGTEFYTKSKPPHVGMYCFDCDGFQHWVKQEHNIDTGEPATAEQQKFALSLMTKWKHSNKPMTVKQAGAIIQWFRED